MWTETLDRRQIIKRALNIETSIDPSEDASQMQLLLRHVRESLEGRNDTTIAVHGDGKSDKLTLSASINLPSPLLPLQWPIHLVKASEAAFTNQFVLPSIRLIHSVKAQVKSLLQHIKEKDHVIDKLIDKMQSDGTDLGRIFPGAPVGKAGSKLMSREAAAKSVKGLGNFDEAQWRHRLKTTNETVSGIDDLVSSVFTSGLIDMRGAGTRQRHATPSGLRSDAIENARDKRKNMAALRPENDNNGDSTTDESDRDNILSSIRGEASSNDVDLAMRLNKPQPQFQPGLSIKVDTATSRRPNSEPLLEDHATQSPSKSPPEQHINLGIWGSHGKASSPVVNERKELLPLAKPKHKLGKIGGKAKEINPSPDSRRGHEDHSNHAPPIDRTSKRPDLMSNGDSQSSEQVTEHGKPAVQHDQGYHGKVSDEQANENRKRLQLDLERMSKVAPKKKRKF